nr:putative phage abortive infection protein [Porphyromonas levii]
MVNQLSVDQIDIDKNERSDGRSAFVVFKIQIHELLKLIEEINLKEKWNLKKDQRLHIAYMIFYYGIDSSWLSFLQGKIKEDVDINILNKILEKIQENKKLKLGRSNQTSLSSYFRNMYNLIKLVDNDKYLSKQEKKSLVTIYSLNCLTPNYMSCSLI